MPFPLVQTVVYIVPYLISQKILSKENPKQINSTVEVEPWTSPSLEF